MTQTSRRATFLLHQRRTWQGFRELLAPSLPPPSGRTVVGTKSKVTRPRSTNLPASHGDDLLALTLLWSPPGRSWMGSPPEEPGRSDDEGPQHLVQLEGFFISRTPITQAQWREVALWEPREGEAWGRELTADPSRFQGSEARLLEGEANTDHRPVEQVSWFDAMEFCSRLSRRTGRTYRLPSEAQWEYACRAGTTTPFHFGDTITPVLANYDGTYTYGDGLKGEDRQQTTPVGSFPANTWGLQDMHGSVWEWCADHWHDSYAGAPDDGSAWLEPDAAEDEGRQLRGGSWCNDPRYCRSAYRFHDAPASLSSSIGFRVVCLPRDPGDDVSIPSGSTSASHHDGHGASDGRDRERQLLELLGAGEATDAVLANRLGGTSLQTLRRLLRDLQRKQLIEEVPSVGRAWRLTAGGHELLRRG